VAEAFRIVADRSTGSSTVLLAFWFTGVDDNVRKPGPPDMGRGDAGDFGYFGQYSSENFIRVGE